MKINDYVSGPGAGVYTGEARSKAKDAGTTPQDPKTSAAGGGDKVQISDRSREIARALDIARGAPETRTDKVADLKARLAAGTYDAKAELVADKMLKSAIDESV